MGKNKNCILITDVAEREELRKNLFLYTMAVRDINTASSFFNEIKDAKLEKISDSIIFGKTYTFIICYGRIFHKNNDLGKIEFHNINQDLTHEEKVMHEMLMSLRDKNYAHSDPENNFILVYYDKENKKICSIANYSYTSLAHNKEFISSLIDKIKHNLESKRDDILCKIYSQDNSYCVNEKQSFTVSYYKGFNENPIKRIDS